LPDGTYYTAIDDIGGINANAVADLEFTTTGHIYSKQKSITNYDYGLWLPSGANPADYELVVTNYTENWFDEGLDYHGFSGTISGNGVYNLGTPQSFGARYLRFGNGYAQITADCVIRKVSNPSVATPTFQIMVWASYGGYPPP
jgi:hypothetical protein